MVFIEFRRAAARLRAKIAVSAQFPHEQTLRTPKLHLPHARSVITQTRSAGMLEQKESVLGSLSHSSPRAPR